MSIGMSVLAILDEGPSYGLRIRNDFESRTGGVWPLNVGQVYQTLSRLERDGLVTGQNDEPSDAQKSYEITASGRAALLDWFDRPATDGPPAREELVLKLVMAAEHPGVEAATVIQAERRAAVQRLQEFTRLKRDAPEDADLGWLFLVDSLIFQTEARVRWLDACEARLGRGRRRRGAAADDIAAATLETEEARR